VALSALFAATCILLPESPRHACKVGNKALAKQALLWLRGSERLAEEELAEILGALDSAQGEEDANRKKSVLDEPAFLPALAVGLSVIVLQQLVGINSVIFFANDILGDPRFGPVIMASGAIGTLSSIPFIDRAGRKVMLATSASVLAVTSATMGFILCHTHVEDLSGATQAVAAVTIIVYVLGFAIGFGPIPWLLMGEIFPPTGRAMASTICTVATWGAAWLITFTFGPLMRWSQPGTFWLYSAMCVVSVVLTVFFLPETRGKSLEENVEIFRRIGQRSAAGKGYTRA